MTDVTFDNLKEDDETRFVVRPATIMPQQFVLRRRWRGENGVNQHDDEQKTQNSYRQHVSQHSAAGWPSLVIQSSGENDILYNKPHETCQANERNTCYAHVTVLRKFWTATGKM